MRELFRRILALLPVGLTIVPFPEMVLPMYYKAPSAITAVAILVLATTISCIQMLYQHWAVGQVKQLAPTWTSKAGTWLDTQLLVKAVRQNTGLMLFLLGLCPGVRVAGITLWRTSKYRWGGYLLAAGTCIQLTIIFGFMLGLGGLISGFLC